jgi:DNA-directed RNA polymerase specialized sigma24 family protein
MWLERAQAEGHTGARVSKRERRRPADLDREIRLFASGGYTQAEIARLVGCDDKAVARRLGRATGAIRGPRSSSASKEERDQP